MKKFVLSGKSMLVLAATACLMVACGLKITKVEFSTHTPEQSSELTVSATFEQAVYSNEHDYNPQANYYQFFAIRVPEDWTAASLEVQNDSDTPNPEMVECEPYATYCEFCFPKDGYKWLAFQTKAASKQGVHSQAVIKLNVGEKLGDCRLDVMAGGLHEQFEPSSLLKDGEVDLTVAFGLNLNRDDDKLVSQPDLDGTTPLYFKSSEYLFNAGTISKDEYEGRIAAMKASTSATIHGYTAPVVPDIANVTNDANMDVTVKETSTGIEGVEAAAADAPAEYFDLQGRKVEVPAAGLHIVKRGNKVTKEIVK